MNETGYFPDTQAAYGCSGRILRVHRTRNQRWDNDSLDGNELGLGSNGEVSKEKLTVHPYPAERTPPP